MNMIALENPYYPKVPGHSNIMHIPSQMRNTIHQFILELFQFESWIIFHHDYFTPSFTGHQHGAPWNIESYFTSHFHINSSIEYVMNSTTIKYIYIYIMRYINQKQEAVQQKNKIIFYISGTRKNILQEVSVKKSSLSCSTSLLLYRIDTLAFICLAS